MLKSDNVSRDKVIEVEAPHMSICVIDPNGPSPRIIARFFYPSDALEFMKVTNNIFKLYIQGLNGDLVSWYNVSHENQG